MRQLYLAFVLTVLIGGQHYNLANAIKLRLVSNIEDDDLVALDDYSFAQLTAEQSYFAQVETELNSFAQVGQNKTFGFTWTNIHDCNWVHRRLRYNQLPSYDTQLATLKAAGLKYVDETMPKEDAIQWLDVATGSNGDLSGYANSPYLKWLRISDYFPKSLGYSLYGFDGLATVDDIMQGSIGNCWFMAAASAIAEIPGRIERAFGTKDQYDNGAGFFDIELYILSVPITVRIDDFLPTYNSYTQTLFAKVQKKGLWMSILEKAFAKLLGNYSSLVAGSPERAVQALIGTPGSSFNIRVMTTTAIYDTINKIQIEDVMIATSWSTSFYGITATHAYTLIDNYTVQKISGGTVQLIKLRDPWGTDSSFKGEYRDGDILWNDVSAAEKTRIGYAINAMDGIFFMTVVQFKEAFSSISNSKMLKDWTRSYFLVLDDKLVNPGKNINGGPLYTRHEFTITSALSQNAIFQVNNHEKRTYPMITGCGAGVGVVNVKTIVEWSLPGSSGQTWFQEGEYNLKSGEPYALQAGVVYRINLELWGGNLNIARDFSVVAWGQKGSVTIKHVRGLVSDNYWNGN